MVDNQLRTAGFDPDLSAADMTVRESAIKPARSYANAVEASCSSQTSAPRVRSDLKADKQETKFWIARRSLRLWPIPGGDREYLEDYLRSKLRFDEAFIRDDLGETTISKTREPRNKNKDEYIVTFETKQIRDAIKAAAANLANFRETAGMRLHVPDHLQRDFRILMNLSYDLKKHHKDLKRNIKFDEEDNGLFMDLQLRSGSDWKRVKPEHAAAATGQKTRNRTQGLNPEELRDLLSLTGEDSD